MDNNEFLWVKFYEELADSLLPYRHNRGAFIEVIKKIYSNTGIKMPKLDDGELIDIDPFTFYGLFNKGISRKHRNILVEEIKNQFHLEAPAPKTYEGIPVLNNLNATYYGFGDDREDQDIDKLWEVFERAISYADNPSNKAKNDFIHAYEDVVVLKYIKWKFSIGLYWIRPNFYINLDQKNREMILEENMLSESFRNNFKKVIAKDRMPSAEVYLDICKTMREFVVNSGIYSSLPNFSDGAEQRAQSLKQADGWIGADYDSGLTVSDWVELLNDHTIFDKDSLSIMRRMQAHGGEATCSELADQYGETANYYNSGSRSLAKRIINKTGCPIYKDSEGKQSFWPLLYLGKKADESHTGSFVWKLRDELAKALDEVDLSSIELYSKIEDNVLLYNDSIRYWLYAPGTNDSNWQQNINDGVMSIGWSDLGDFSTYESQESIRLELQTLNDSKQSYKNASLAIWEFTNEIKPGDVIFVKTGRNTILGYGVVLSDYIYDESVVGDYKNIRRVDWKKTGEWKVNWSVALKTLTDITYNNSYVDDLKHILIDSEDQQLEKEVAYSTYTKDDFLNDVFMDEEQYDMLVDVLRYKKNIVLQGAPGTGKTYAAKRLAYSILGEQNVEQVNMIQFHQSYSYEDFIMGYRPTETGFVLNEGVFYQFCKKALEDKENEYFFIIDEINRGNLSKIFGELFMLIENDKRNVPMRLLYRDEDFVVPANVYIIGMMNTADRSLAMLDYALRRRFAFFDFKPAFETKGFKEYLEDKDNEKLNRLIACVNKLNKEIRLDESLGEGFEIGHSYFMTKNEVTDTFLNRVVSCELIQLLKEYWYDDPDLVEDWGNRLKAAIK